MSEDIFQLGIKALIRDKKGHILLLQVNSSTLRGGHQDYWDLPGGRLQKGELPETALKREILEEVGVTEISNIQHVAMVLSNIRIPTSDSDSVGLILSVYRGTVPDNIRIGISDEHVAFEWFMPTKAAELLQVKYPKEFCNAVAALD